MKQNKTDNSRTLINIYNSSLPYSLTAVSVVAALELFMLAYTIANAPFYGGFLWTYRTFYILLLTAAIVYIALCLYARKNMEERYKCFNIANPIYAVFFYAWALLITYQDFSATGVLDTAVFMTFSLIVPLAFYVKPRLYAIVAVVTDIIMFYLITRGSGGVGQMINTGFFIIFQLVLGISFLMLKTQNAERIIQEQENANIDVLTGCGNRRAYTNEMEANAGGEIQQGLSYLAIDIDGLKEINDSYGHEAGDKVISGAAECIEGCFGTKGKVYRIGGDEFAVLTTEDAPEDLLTVLKANIQSWSEKNNLELSASCGYASGADHPDADIYELARIADSRMLEAKAEYYLQNGKDRRKQQS